jgi:hypothetical protein
MKNAHSKLSEFAILDELAKMREGFFLAVGNEFDEVEHRLDYASLKIVAAFVPKHS